MKKVITLAFAALTANFVFAGGIDSKTNLSTGYHRNPSRNTECERPEAVFYNIAGTGFMKNGLYVEAGNQFVFKNYSNTYDGTSITGIMNNGDKFEDKEIVYLYPDANIVYKHDNFSLFGGFAVAGGGGTLKYNDGTAATTAIFASKASTAQNAATAYSTSGNTSEATKYGAMATALAGAAKSHSLEVYSVTYGETLGAAYQINDIFSVSAAVRLLENTQNLSLTSSSLKTINGGSEIGYDAFGFGAGGIFGVHAKPVAGLDVAVQYKTITKMDVEFKSMTGSLASTLLNNAEEGDTFYNDMPAELNVGVGYRVIEPLYINTSFNYYFNKQASISNALDSTTKIKYNDSWEIGGGADYKINEKILASLGAMYSHQGTKTTVNNLFAPVLDCVNVGLGVEVKPVENLAITAGGVYAKYFEEDYEMSGADFKLNKEVFLFSIGATYRFDL